MSEMNRTDCHLCPSCPIDRRASEEERRTYYERYAKARAHEVDRCRDVRWATRGTIVRERLKCEGYLWLRQRGVSFSLTRDDANRKSTTAVAVHSGNHESVIPDIHQPSDRF